MDRNVIIAYAVTVLGAYFLGAIPFSFILGRLFGGVDLRQVGSGNPGATNLYRSCGPVLGIIGLSLDVAKGAIPVLVFPLIFSPAYIVYAAGAAAVIGHMYTIFLGFKGGKGVATAAGVMLAISWQISLIALGIFLLVVIIFRFISLGSISAAVSIIISSILLPLFRVGGYDWALSIFCGVFGVLIIIAHRKNIKRLLKGEENKFSLKSRRKESSKNEA
jgi:glycerol-3-phosphate acyltransferase PlsY